MKEESRFAVHDLTKKYLLSQLSELGIVLCGTLNTLNSVIGKAFKNYIFFTHGGKAEVLTLTAPAELNLPIGTTVTYYNQRYEKDFIKFLGSWIKANSYKYFQGDLDVLNARLNTLTIVEETITEKTKFKSSHCKDLFHAVNKIDYIERIIGKDLFHDKYSVLINLYANYKNQFSDEFKVVLDKALKTIEDGVRSPKSFDVPLFVYLFLFFKNVVLMLDKNRGGEAEAVSKSQIDTILKDFSFSSLREFPLHFVAESYKSKIFDLEKNQMLMSDFHQRLLAILCKFLSGNMTMKELQATIPMNLHVFDEHNFILVYSATNKATPHSWGVKSKTPHLALGRDCKTIEEIIEALKQNGIISSKYCIHTPSHKQILVTFIRFYTEQRKKGKINFLFADFFKEKTAIRKSLDAPHMDVEELPMDYINEIVDAIIYYEHLITAVRERIPISDDESDPYRTLRDNMPNLSSLPVFIFADFLSEDSELSKKRLDIVAANWAKNHVFVHDCAKKLSQYAAAKKSKQIDPTEPQKNSIVNDDPNDPNMQIVEITHYPTLTDKLMCKLINKKIKPWVETHKVPKTVK